MIKHSKRYQQGLEEIARDEVVELEQAIDLLKKQPKANFDETVEVAMNLGIDPKQSDQQVRGSIGLPNGLGKTVRAIVFAEGEDADAAKEAGALEVGSDDLVQKVSDGWADFDVVIAHRSMMPKIGKLGRVLGPRGLMPSPKTGTVTDDVVGVLKEYLAGKVEYRADSGGNLHAPVGKMSFETQALVENIRTFVKTIKAARPQTTKGMFIKSVTVSSTMSPGIKVSV